MGESSLENIKFPFLFGGTFIEAKKTPGAAAHRGHFPSFSEGLSLRLAHHPPAEAPFSAFPFLFGGTFIEATTLRWHLRGTGISLPFRRDFH